MINRIIDFSARHRLLIVAGAVFAALLGWRALKRFPLDALPELADTQVIIHSAWDRSPEVIDAQVTYPIVSSLLGAPRVKSVRGISDLGSSFVYVTFEEGTDLYWARSRIIEYLATIQPRLPEDVRVELGPDATALGWVFQYALVDRSGTHQPDELRSYQDWYLKYYLKAIPGVADVATVGGFVRQYQINLDPNRLRAYGISTKQVVAALRGSNNEATGKVVDSGGAEFIVRGLGYAHNTADLENILVATAPDGTPYRIKDLGHVAIGSDFRRGVADLDGEGGTVSGIVIMRQGQNALEVIDRVKQRLRQLEPSLPKGVEVVAVYDRSDFVRRSIDNLNTTIVEVMLTVAIVILVFLWHPPSASVPLLTIPFAVLIAFVPFQMLGLSANIMSLGGIAIAIGAMVDASIVMVEQTHKKLEEWDRLGRPTEASSIVLRAVKQVARPSFFALIVIAVSFTPVLSLQAEEGRLFRPLAYTKSLAMLIAAVLAVTLVPVLQLTFMRAEPVSLRLRWLEGIINRLWVGRIHREERHPLTRWMVRVYEPIVSWSLCHKPVVFGTALLMVALTIPVWMRLGAEFMPPLDEGVLLYMPTTMPGISVGQAEQLLTATDRTLREFPEVERVLGKAGRADTATDPAPLSMLETLVVLKPASQWPRVPRWYSSWAPGWLKPVLSRFAPEHASREELVRRMDQALKLPGLANAWTMPVRGRIDMLATGVRTPVGLRISGSNVAEVERLGVEAANLLRSVPNTRAVFAERAAQGNFLDVQWDLAAMARAGVTMEDAQSTVRYAIGGENVSVMLDGRERYPINARYASEFRDSAQSIEHALVPAANGSRQVPVSEIGRVVVSTAPVMLRNDDGLLSEYVYVDVSTEDLSGYVREGDRLLREKLALPPGYSASWTGQYEAIERTRRRLWSVVPMTLLIIFLLLYVNTRSVLKSAIVLLAVPFSAVGAIWALYLLDYHLSIAVWIGLIALLGVDAETGVFMLLYLDDAYERARLEFGNTADALQRAVLEGAARRLRPKVMTVATMFFGLLPIMLSAGTGSDLMKRIAAPMIGGILTSFVLELWVYPAVYHAWKVRAVRNHEMASAEVELNLS